MGFERKKLEESRIQANFGTVGGTTYFLNNRAVCLAQLGSEGRTHQYCANEAGLKTDHIGTGRCAFHGGSAGTKIQHGRYAKVAKRKYAEHFQEYLNDPDLLNLTPELALQRMLLTDMFEKYQDDPSLVEEKNMLNLISNVITTVEKIEKIQSQHVLTASAAKLMMARAVEVQRRMLQEWFQGQPVEVIEDHMNRWLLVWRSEVEPRDI